MRDVLELTAHVHGRPHQLVTSRYSWANGVGPAELTEVITNWERAFTPIRIDAVLDGQPATWYFNAKTKEIYKD